MQIRKIVMLAGIVLAVPSGMVWAQENVQKQIPALKSDTRIQVKSGYASNYQREEGIEKSFDGDEKTLYHSSWGNTRFPVTLEYKLEKAERVDYLLYQPRMDGANGRFGAFELWVSTRRSPEFIKIGDYDFKETGSPSVIYFKETIRQSLAFRFVVKSGGSGFVSCAEMEFRSKNNENRYPEDVFTDATCSALKSGITAKEIKQVRNPFYRALAEQLMMDTLCEAYRVQYYEAYPPVEETARKLKTSGYNSFENPTGIYFSEGEEVVVLVGDTQGQSVSLRVHSFEPDGADQTYLLFPGTNRLKMKAKGLGYLNFFTTDYARVAPVKVHIVGGQVNGYFDKSNDNNADWQKLLENAVCNIMDIKGDYVNLAYRVSSLKKHCPEKGRELIDAYDEIIDIQHEMMGLKKYNIRPKNHMFAREVEGGLYADGWGAAFAWDCMHELANPDKIKAGLWALAHEFGHVNQIRPGLKWVSTTEVTNNIFSVWTRYLLDPVYRNLEHERVNDGDNNRVLGGRFNAYLNYGIVKGEQWLCQRGQDRMKDYENGGDHFVKLCPLWQLQLYYAVAGKGNYWQKADWFADVAQIVRNTDESRMSDGQLQLNFMRNVCDIVKEDLSDFFIRAGMLKPIDKYMDDYGRAQLTITRQQCDELVKYLSRYPKPASPVIYYLTANSVQAYQKRLPVEGIYGQGITLKDGICTIDHRFWKNVAVFETYTGDELAYVSMVGTNSPDQSTSWVRYPENSTRIEAVAWDGTRTLVYGKR